MNTKLLISKKQIHSNEFINTILLSLNYFYKQSSDTVFFNQRDIFYLLTGRLPQIREQKKDRTIWNNIQKGLHLLCQEHIIHFVFSQHDFFEIVASDLYIDFSKHYFVQVEISELQQIFHSCAKPFAVSNFYIQMLAFINQKTHVFHMTQNDLCQYFQISQNTLRGYLDQLQALKLIYVHTAQRYQITGEQIKNIISFYGRYQHQEEIIQASEKYMERLQTYQQFRRINRRSIKLKYFAFLKGAKKYQKLEVVEDLYQDCITYNDSYQVDGKDEDIQHKLIDLQPIQQALSKLKKEQGD